VKIPKTVRKGPVAKFLNSSAGQLLLAETLVVVGGALAAERSGSGSGLAELVRNRARSGSSPSGYVAWQYVVGRESYLPPRSRLEAERSF
jgi:hypothetical protein